MKYSYIFFVILPIFWAFPVYSQFFEDDHILTDVKNNILWYRCSVGQSWDIDQNLCWRNGKTESRRNKYSSQASFNSVRRRLEVTNVERTREPCMPKLQPPKIKKKYFPNISPEAYWTKKKFP